MKSENEENGEEVLFLNFEEDTQTLLKHHVESNEIENIIYSRISCIISLSLIILYYLAVFFFTIPTGNIALLFGLHHSRRDHFEINGAFYNICSGFIIFSCGFTIIRLLNMLEIDRKEKNEILQIHKLNYHHLYNLGNIFLLIFMFLTNFNNQEIILINCFIGGISLILYSIVYHNFYTNIQTNSFNNIIAYELNISFLFTWTLLLEYYYIFFYFKSSLILNKESINMIALILHISINLINLVFVSYYCDVFFCFIILIYQVGIVLHNSYLNNNDDEMTFIFCVLSFVCFIYAMFKSIKRIDTKSIDPKKSNNTTMNKQMKL